MKRLNENARDSEVKMDMTSMIDVVFLLLIFFMCATKFKIPEGALRSFLPRDKGNATTEVVVSNNCRVTLYKNSQGETVCLADNVTIVNNSKGEFEQEVTPELYGPDLGELKAHILNRKETYDGLAGALPVIVDFRKDVPYHYVVQVLDICKELEITDFSMAMPEIPMEGQ